MTSQEMGKNQNTNGNVVRTVSIARKNLNPQS